MTWLTVVEYLCHKWPRICSTCRKHFPVHSSFVTYHRVLTWLTRRVSLVEQELPTLSEHLSSPPVSSGVRVRVPRSLVLCVCFVDRCLFFCSFSFGHCVVCSSSIYTDSDYPFSIFKLFLSILQYLNSDVIEWVRKCLLLNAKLSNASAVLHGKNKLKMKMMSALYNTNTNWIFIVLAHWDNNQCVNTLLHSDTL